MEPQTVRSSVPTGGLPPGGGGGGLPPGGGGGGLPPPLPPPLLPPFPPPLPPLLEHYIKVIRIPYQKYDTYHNYLQYSMHILAFHNIC